jgi:hypothetical protein
MSLYGDVTERRIRMVGEDMQVIRRRRSLLLDTGAGIPANARSRGTVVTQVKARNAATSGATHIDLYAANLSGFIQRGSTINVAGHSYEVAASVAAINGILSSVPLTTPLLTNVAAEAPVGTPQAYSDLPHYAMRSTYEQQDIDGGATADKVLFRVVPIAGETWENGDLIVVDGVVRRAEVINSTGPSGAPIRWDILAGEAA